MQPALLKEMLDQTDKLDRISKAIERYQIIARAIEKGKKMRTLMTFLPFPEFHWSASVLDNKTLGAQRVETLQIMTILLLDEGWVDNPAVKMWRGHERMLLAYQQAICNEWVNVRGFKDTFWDQTRILFLDMVKNPMAIPMIPPKWIGNVDFHISHQSNLLRKDEAHYRPQFPGIRNDHPYIWPVQ